MTPAARVLEDLDAEVLELVDRGLCGCGCGKRLPAGGHARRRYITPGHRQRQYRRRLEAEARALGIPARLSLARLDALDSTDARHRDAHNGRGAPRRRRPAPRPGVSVYLPTLELADALVAMLGDAGALGWNADEVLKRLEPAILRTRRRLGLAP